MAQAKIAGGLDKITVIHGDACGADAHARNFCKVYEVAEEKHPADWKSFGKAAGPIRNSVMIATGADVVLAFPRNAGRGTMDCVMKARAKEIPVIFG
jgi:hypothetical protein